MKKQFELKREHLKLINQMWINWDGCEYGAPNVDPKRPYGNSYVEGDIREILENENLTEKECRKLHKETQFALQILVRNARVALGKYESDEYDQNWKKVK